MWFLKRSRWSAGEVKDEKIAILERLKSGEWLPPEITPSATHTSWNLLEVVPLAGVILLIALALWLPFHINHNGNGHVSSPTPDKVATANSTGGTQAENQTVSPSNKPSSSPKTVNSQTRNTSPSSSLDTNNASLASLASTSGNYGAAATQSGGGTAPTINGAASSVSGTAPTLNASAPQHSSESTSRPEQSGLVNLPTASVTVPAQNVGILGQPLLATPSIGVQL